MARVIAGNAGETVSALDGPFDLVFIDAEKDDDVDHFLAVIDRVRPGGLILADNVISHDIFGVSIDGAVRTDVETVTVPIGRGVEFTVKTV